MSTTLLCHNISDKLIAVNYPYSWNDKAAAASEVDFRNLRDIVVFLEDTLLRTLPPVSRETLKKASNEKEFFQALHDYCDSNNNTNITRLCAGSVFQNTSSSSTNNFNGGTAKVLEDLLRHGTRQRDFAALVLVDRLLDTAIAQLVQDKSMNLEAAHAKWIDEQGKRNVSSLDLSNSLKSNNNNTTKKNDDGKKPSASPAAGLHKSIEQILSLRNSQKVNNDDGGNSKNITPLHASVGAASRLAMGLLDYDFYQEQQQQQANNNNNNNKDGRKKSNVINNMVPAVLDQDWTRLALSEIPLWGQLRTIYPLINGKQPPKSTTTTTTLVQDCARALRAIYTEDFATLQRRVNVSLARLQELTATCATDPKLGRTGR